MEISSISTQISFINCLIVAKRVKSATGSEALGRIGTSGQQAGFFFCEQYIKFECNGDVSFVQQSVAWWVSRDGKKMNYWGGAGGSANTCACGVTNSCSNGQKCNCHELDRGWREDSGLLTQIKTAVCVTNQTGGPGSTR